MIKLKWNGRSLPFVKIEWSGTANQSSRQIVFAMPWNPYDKDFKAEKIRLGDLVHMYDGKTLLFVGTVTAREQTAEAGSVSYTAKDFMHFLLRSNGTYKFRNTTPEKITRQLCRELGIQTAELAETGVNISKMYFDDKCIYDIIVAAYRRARARTRTKYMPVMDGKKLSVIAKGQRSGVVLDQSRDITGASYQDTTDNMVNVVKIYNDAMALAGMVQNKKHVEKYGIYQAAYKKEKGVNAKDEAEAMLEGITREASVESVGYIKAVSGYSLEIRDSAAGLSGMFYIDGDTHTFENGVHTMSLELSWNNVMAESAESEQKAGKKELSGRMKCYYIEGADVYHASVSCTACKGRTTRTSTVAEIKKIKIARGENKGKRRYRPCSKCWIT